MCRAIFFCFLSVASLAVGELSARGSLSAAACRHDRPGRLIRAESLGALDREEIRKTRTRAIDAALDRANGAAANVGRLLVGEARCADENQRFALIGRKLRECRTEFLEFEPTALLRVRLQTF